MSYDETISKVLVPGYMDISLNEYANRIIVCIENEQKKMGIDKVLLAVLYDALRCGWELNKKSTDGLKELKKKIDSS